MFHDHRRWSLDHVAPGSLDAVRPQIDVDDRDEKPKYVRTSSLVAILMLSAIAWAPIAMILWRFWPA